MRTTKENLYTIAQELIERSIKSSVILNRKMEFIEIRNQILEELDSKKTTLLSMSENINVLYLKNFIAHPKISNVLNDYLLYLINMRCIQTNLDSVKGKFSSGIFIGDILNYFTNVIEVYFQNIVEEEIIILKTFVEIISGICFSTEQSSETFEGEYMIKQPEIGQMFVFPNLGEAQINDNILISKIEYELNNNFVPLNSLYANTKNIYMKALKSVYQMGFVYLLGEYKFNEFYIPPLILNAKFKDLEFYTKLRSRITKTKYREFRNSWTDIFVNNDIVYIVGGPGFGKSLFLKNIINNYSKLTINHSIEYLLIYCDLKTFYSKGKPNKKSIVDFLQESMINITGLDEGKISKEFIQYYIDLGRCVILLDALDEVPKEVREELHKKIIAFFSTCNPHNKICITSRDRGFLPKAEIEVFEIYPLTSMDIEDYLDKMIGLKKFKKEDKQCFMEQAQILIDKNFLNNFLALSLLVSIYKSEKKLPENKTNLYKKCFEYIAKDREIEEKDEIGFDWENVAPLIKDSTFISLATLGVPNNKDIDRKDVENLLLRQYKIRYLDEVKAECAIREFLEFCTNRTELFVPSSVDDKFKFFHRSFFEYFYSRYIHQCSDVEEMYRLMSIFDVDSEVFELTVALVKEDNEVKYQMLIDYLLKMVDEEFSADAKKDTAFYILTLAMQVIDDAYFKQCYFEIIINYRDKFFNNEVQNINNELILTWINNAIAIKQENWEIFKKEYEENCIIYVFILFSSLEKCQLPNIIREDIKITTSEYLIFEHREITPFYVSVYKQQVNIFEKLESYCKRPIKRIMESFNSSLSRKQRTKIKRGINNYKSLNEEQKKDLCEKI